MFRALNNLRSSSCRLPAFALATALAAGMILPAQAFAAAKEVNLADAAQALAYCQSGAMPAGDIAYFASSGGGVAQHGPETKCAQVIPKKTVRNALQIKGSTVKECKLAIATAATDLCNAGGIGTWDIDYIAGPVTSTIGGPGYGCPTSTNSGGIGNAICK